MRVLFSLGLLSVVFLSGCEIASPLHPGDVQVYSTCGNSPNYIDGGELRRWASFPLTVSVSIDPDVVGASNVGLYRLAAYDGIAAWSQRLPQPMGSVVIGDDLPNPQISVTFQSFGDGTNLGTAKYDPPRILTDVDILVYLSSNTGGPATWLSQVNQGLLSFSAWRNDVATIVAHEMGHALGIAEHSPDPGDIMYFQQLRRGLPPAWLISDADINTMLHSYCQR